MSLFTSYWLCSELCLGLVVPLSLQWAHIMSHHAKCFDTATQRALPIWCQSPQVLVSSRWRLSERARTKSPPQQHRTMQPDWQQKGQNGASLSNGCLSGRRERKKDSGTGAYIGSTKKRIGRKQDVICWVTVKQKQRLTSVHNVRTVKSHEHWFNHWKLVEPNHSLNTGYTHNINTYQCLSQTAKCLPTHWHRSSTGIKKKQKTIYDTKGQAYTSSTPQKHRETSCWPSINEHNLLCSDLLFMFLKMLRMGRICL